MTGREKTDAGKCRYRKANIHLVSGSYSRKPFFNVGVGVGFDSRVLFLAVTLGRLLNNPVSFDLPPKMGE